LFATHKADQYGLTSSKLEHFAFQITRAATGYLKKTTPILQVASTCSKWAKPVHGKMDCTNQIKGYLKPIQQVFR